jgi:hypothetical protein
MAVRKSDNRGKLTEEELELLATPDAELRERLKVFSLTRAGLPDVSRAVSRGSSCYKHTSISTTSSASL